MPQLPLRSALLAALLAGAAPAQSFDVFSQDRAPYEVLAQLDVGTATLQDLDVPSAPGAPFSVDVDLGAEREQLVLWPHSLRSSDYQLLVQGEDGALVPHAPSPSATYRGVVPGHPESVVAASLHGGRLEALVRLAPDREVWSIQAAAGFDASAPADRYVVSSSLDALPQDVTCGTGNVSFEEHPHASPGGAAAGGAPELLLCEIACDADTQFYNLNGSSVANTEADIESILNAVAAIYEADVAITYEITTILVRTAEPDPYSTSNAGDMLGEFQAEWTQNQGTVQRDVAHLFTGKNISGSTIGIAWLASICSNAFGYGLSQSKFSGNFNSRVGLTAHELGHNWSANHCNGAPKGCQIMCSSLGGCGPVTSFAPKSINKISNYAPLVGCVDETGGEPPQPPVIAAFAPSAEVPAVTVGNDFHVSVLGTDMDTITDVIVDGFSLGDAFPPGFTIAGETQLDLVLPLFDQLGPVDVTVVGVAGSDTASLEVVANGTPALELGSGGSPEVLLSIVPLTLTSGGTPGTVHFVWASFTLLPTTVPGTLDLAIGNGFLDLYLVDLPVVDAKGWSQLSLSGVNLPGNTTVYFQSFEYDLVSGALPVESSNVAEGLWIF